MRDYINMAYRGQRRKLHGPITPSSHAGAPIYCSPNPWRSCATPRKARCALRNHSRIAAQRHIRLLDHCAPPSVGLRNGVPTNEPPGASDWIPRRLSVGRTNRQTPGKRSFPGAGIDRNLADLAGPIRSEYTQGCRSTNMNWLTDAAKASPRSPVGWPYIT